MNWFTKDRIIARARRDARADVNSVEDVVLEHLGPKQTLDPVGNAEHGYAVAASGRTGLVEEHRADVDHLNKERARHLPVLQRTVALIFLFIVESWGAILVMETLGLEGIDRVVLGGALAAVVWYLTTVAARPTGTAADGSTRRRSWGWLLVLVGYALVVTAIAVVRLNAMAQEETSEEFDVATAVIMVLCSVGPAALAHRLIQERAPGAALAREQRVIRAALARETKTVERGERFLVRRARETEGWERNAATIRATYAGEHRAELTRVRPVGPARGRTRRP